MQIGCFYFPVDYGIDVRELARAMEDRGFESLFFPEHTHIPTSRQSPWPGGGELPKCYSHTHDPFVACTAAAVVTEKLKIGTGICLVPQHEPIVTAKAIASVDQISGGRFMFGIGGGWNVEEMEDHGATYKTRFAIMREHILAMKQLWTQEEASFDGEFVKFPPSWSWPKPVQNPHPPILLGVRLIIPLSGSSSIVMDGILALGRALTLLKQSRDLSVLQMRLVGICRHSRLQLFVQKQMHNHWRSMLMPALLERF